MKVFVLVLITATLVGGFVGGEVSDRTFSPLGAVIGGVGTATVLLALGAYFTAQEEKRKKEALPPEMRKVFDRMFGSPAEARALVNATAKWRPRPFHHNKSKTDEAHWFANAPGWSRIDSRLITVLIDRLHGNPMFELFVHASQDCNVVAKYEPLSALFNRGVGNVAALPSVAEILSTAGAAHGAKFTDLVQSKSASKEELTRLYQNAMNACEASVHVEPNYIPSYIHLAVLRSLVNNKNDAIDVCNRGLEAVKRLRRAPFHLSDLPTIKNAGQDIDKFESHIMSIMASLQR